MTAADVGLRRRLRRRAWWLLARILLGCAAALPAGAGRALGRGLGRAALRLRPGERARARRNLETAFPGLAAGERDALLEDSAAALGRNLWDTLAAPRLLRRPDVLTQERGPGGDLPLEVLARLRARGRGVFVLTGHLGCWELLGGWLAGRPEAAGEPPFAVVTGTIHNPAVDRLLQGRRRDLGLRVLPREQGAAPLLRHLRQGGVAGVLLDQATAAGNLAAPFFGRPAPTPAGLARIALRHGVPVLPLAVAWDPARHGHVLRHLRPLEPAAGGGDAAAFLAECNGRLETFIRRNPAEWVWFHERWPAAYDTAPAEGASE